MSPFVDTGMSSGRRILFALTLFAGLGALSLGGWQLRRLLARRAWNAAAMAARDLPEIDLAAGSLPPTANYRRVRLEGRFDFAHEITIRGRLLLGTPGIQVVTPLRLPGRDTAILVHRGFVPTSDAGLPATTDFYTEPDSAAFQGIALTIPDEGDGGPLETANGRTWHRLDLAAIRAATPYPIGPQYVIMIGDTLRTREHTVKGHSLPIRIEPPPLDDGPHLSYAIQWLMIAGAAIGFGLVFVRKRPGPSRGPDEVSP